MVGEIKTATRFDSRVANYAAYRPGYPPELIAFLRDELGLGPGSVVADVGSGTGILSGMLLGEGCRVLAVEPNDSMREAAEAALGGDPNFASVNGTAEATTLEDASVDLVTAAQAFHWFDAERARAEVRRILRPRGRAVVVWNNRRTDSTAFLRDYESLLRRFGTDYAQVAATYGDENSLRKFFTRGYEVKQFDNFQLFDFDGLKGRLLSASYVPLAGHPSHEPMLAELRRVFDAHQQDGRVRIEYDADVYYGKLSAVGD